MKIFQFQSRIFDLVQKWVDQKDQVVFEKFRKNAWKTIIGFLFYLLLAADLKLGFNLPKNLFYLF